MGLTLTRQVLQEGFDVLAQASNDEDAYLDRFKVTFPDGLNTASVMEICRILQNSTFETKVRLMKLCIAGKNVEVTCPNGEVEKFCLTNPDDNLEGFPLFQKEPLSLIAISDMIYGFVLKKSVRLSKPKEAVAK